MSNFEIGRLPDDNYFDLFDAVAVNDQLVKQDPLAAVDHWDSVSVDFANSRGFSPEQFRQMSLVVSDDRSKLIALAGIYKKYYEDR